MLPELKRYAFLAVVLAVVALSAIGLDALQSSHEARVAAVSSAAGDTTNTAGSVSAELGKLTGSLYQNATAASTARAPESAQFATASSRAELMKNLAETNPAAFLGYALPKEVRAKLPTSVRAQVEEYKTLTGEIEVLHIDDFENHKNSKFKYFLRVGGKRLALYSAGDLPALLSGSQLSIKGYQLGDIVVTTGGPAEVTVRKVAKPESVGNQRTLVILLKNPDTAPLDTPANIRKDIFSGDFQKFYQEQSYGKIRFSGTVTEWIDSNYSDSGTCQAIGSLDLPEIDGYLTSHGIDVAGYARVIFVHNNTYGGCATVGKIEGYFHGQPFRLSFGWAGLNKGFSGSFSSFDFVLSHEMGHELGVWHASAWDCTIPPLADPDCHIEYGSWFDTMGLSTYGAHFNAFYKNFLGWLPRASIRTVTKSGTYALAPLEGTSGVRALILENPALKTYGQAGAEYVEYRQPIGFDSKLPLQSAGLFINQLFVLPYWHEPHLINANYATDPKSYHAPWQPALMPGSTFIDSYYGFTIDSVQLSSTTASLHVEVTQPVCDLRGLILTEIPGTTDSIRAGGAGWNQVFYRNADSLACGISAISSSASISNSNDGWLLTVNSATSSIIQSRDAQYLLVTYYVPPDTPAGDHTLTRTLHDTTHNRTYTIEKTITVTRPTESVALTSITPSTGAAGIQVVANGSGFTMSNTVHVGT